MSENDKDPRPGEFTDPTASPDWTAPSQSENPPTEQIPQASPTEQIPQGSPTEQIPQAAEFPPSVPPAPSFGSPSYDAPYQAPRGQSNPYAGSSAQPTNPYAATPPPAGDPYAVPQPAYDPYAATVGVGAQGGYPAYSAPGQWQAPPPAYGAPPAQNTSALVLTILSGIATLTCCLPMVVSAVIGIIALTKNATDPEGSRRLTKWGWIAFGVLLALSIIAIIVFISLGVSGVFDDGGYSPDSDYTY
ncbi:hypothetical protein JNB_16684 [Janibacter sp. HTCC2649]|uniref:hypothetical protein n=1 Tax=Janibacter sp. HTCC2649 TaxID=313589 RepID=UPI000067119D|nr:hypothetical protein [Janibacter sp. HTCC2649]EAP97140.1 hypothetical protein JNB_16684 [Janibacter sp. HTCC2649]